MEVPHELGSELRSSVADHLLGNSELFPHIVVEEFSGAHGRDFSIGGNSYYVLGKSVDDYHYRIISLRYR